MTYKNQNRTGIGAHPKKSGYLRDIQPATRPPWGGLKPAG